MRGFVVLVNFVARVHGVSLCWCTRVKIYAHTQRMERVARIVRTEGDTRKHVLNRIEAKRKQLEIAVTDVQRLFRGHLGRRRFRSRAVFQWELRLHLAAKKIQAMYRDRIDSQWASYVNKGNLQVLVGRRAARELRVLRKSQVRPFLSVGVWGHAVVPVPVCLLSTRKACCLSSRPAHFICRCLEPWGSDARRLSWLRSMRGR